MRTSAPWGITTIIAVLALVGSACVGAWATASAVVDGDVAGTLVRFGAATVLGTYYFVLYRTARRQRVR